MPVQLLPLLLSVTSNTKQHYIVFLCYRFEDVVVAAQLSHIWRYLPTGRFLFSSGEDPRDKPLRAVRRVFVTPTSTTTEMIVFSTKHVTAKYEIIIIG